MSQSGVDKYFGGSIVVNESIRTRSMYADKINGTEIKEYITTKNIPNAQTLKDFTEDDDGLKWNGVTLVPPNSVMEDRPYATDEIAQMIDELWEGYDGSVDKDKVDNEVDTSPGGTVDQDWKKGV